MVSQMGGKNQETSSESEEDDDVLQKLRDAVDPSFRLGEASNNSSCKVKTVPSARHFMNEEEYPKPYLLDLTKETQEFIAKKLSKALDRLIDEIPSSVGPTSVDTEERGVYLFSRSTSFISEEMKEKKQKRPKLKRKRHLDGSESEDEDTKARAVAVSAEWVMNSPY